MAGTESRLNSKLDDSRIVEKASKKTVPAKSIRGMKTLGTKIETAREFVKNYLGDKKFDCITTVEELTRYIDSCCKNGLAAIDTETTGLNVYEAKLVGISLYTKGKNPCYVPLFHVDYTTNERVPTLTYEDVKNQICRLSGTKLIFFNADYDIRVILHNLGVRLNAYFESYIAARLLNENEPENKLKFLHSKYVLNGKKEEFSFGDLFEKIPFNLIPIDVAYLYAANDALVTYELYEFQLPFLTKDSEQCKQFNLQGVANVFWNIEMPIVSTVIDMEEAGVKIDLDYQKILSEDYNNELEKAEKAYYEKLKEYTDTVYSISSPKQLVTLFYDVLHVLQPVFDKKKGKYVRTVDANALSSIDHPLAKLILEYRAMEKLVSTYVDKLRVIAEMDSENRVHAIFNQVGTDTGRFSSKEPNLQNIPSHDTKIRKMFVPSDGYVFVGGDFSRIVC